MRPYGTRRSLRPSLGLDLMEELRSVLADRLALTLINLRQITGKDFEDRTGGRGIFERRGKAIMVAYQKWKQEEFTHPLLEEKIPFGLTPHVQARLLARHLRGDMEEYIPVLYS